MRSRRNQCSNADGSAARRGASVGWSFSARPPAEPDLMVSRSSGSPVTTACAVGQTVHCGRGRGRRCRPGGSLRLRFAMALAHRVGAARVRRGLRACGRGELAPRPCAGRPHRCPRAAQNKRRWKIVTTTAGTLASILFLLSSALRIRRLGSSRRAVTELAHAIRHHGRPALRIH
jgi:hypothetical protein